MSVIPDKIFKCVVIGDSGTGKTSVIYRICENKFNHNHDMTIGVDFAVTYVACDDKNIKIQLWDTAGHERFRSIVRSYYKNAQAVLLCFDLTDNKSFKNLSRWMTEIKNECSSSVEILLIGTKSDKTATKCVSDEEIEKFCEEYGGLSYISTSSKSNTNISETFLHLAKRVSPKIADLKLVSFGIEYPDKMMKSKWYSCCM